MTPSLQAYLTFTCLDGTMDAKDGGDKCMVCHNTSNKPTHHSKDYPILKIIRLKLVKRTPANGGDTASQVGKKAPPPTHQPLHPHLWVPQPVMAGLPHYPGPSQPPLNRKTTIRAKNLTTRECMRESCMPLVVLTLTPKFPCIHALVTFLQTT